MEPSCATCEHSRPTITDDTRPVLECWRYPPQVFTYEGEPAQASPQVEHTDHCGEYREATK